MFSDADAAALYDLLNPWDPARWPSDGFYEDLVMAADSVLDVGCGTGAMLARARELGHTGRLAGLDPDRAALARARRRDGVEWVEGTAADVVWVAEFGLATMVSHAFQCLVTDVDLRPSLAGIRAALREGRPVRVRDAPPAGARLAGVEPGECLRPPGQAGRSSRSRAGFSLTSAILPTGTPRHTGADVPGAALGVVSLSLTRAAPPRDGPL